MFREADGYQRELLAIPLTADQAQELVRVLQEVAARARPGHGEIPEHTGRTAARISNSIIARAGAAVAGDRGYVPQPVAELDEYAKIADMLRTWDSSDSRLDRLTDMLAVMHTLRGMGAVHNWRIVDLRGVLVWVEEPRMRGTTTDMRAPYPTREVERS